MKLDASGVQATILPGRRLAISVKNAATVPVTGLCTPGAESYGGRTISHLPLADGEKVTFSLGSCNPPPAPADERGGQGNHPERAAPQGRLRLRGRGPPDGDRLAGVGAGLPGDRRRNPEPPAAPVAEVRGLSISSGRTWVWSAGGGGAALPDCEDGVGGGAHRADQGVVVELRQATLQRRDQIDLDREPVRNEAALAVGAAEREEDVLGDRPLAGGVDAHPDDVAPGDRLVHVAHDAPHAPVVHRDRAGRAGATGLRAGARRPQPGQERVAHRHRRRDHRRPPPFPGPDQTKNARHPQEDGERPAQQLPHAATAKQPGSFTIAHDGSNLPHAR